MKAACDSDLTQCPTYCGDGSHSCPGRRPQPIQDPGGVWRGASARGARAGHKSTSLRGSGGERGSQGTCCSAPVRTYTAGLHDERARIPSEAQMGPQHKDRTDQHSEMTVTSVQTGRVLSPDLLQRGEPQCPPELKAPRPTGGAGVGGSQNGGWCAEGQAPEGEAGGPGLAGGGRQEAGTRLLSTQEGWGTYSPHGQHGRGTRPQKHTSTLAGGLQARKAQDNAPRSPSPLLSCLGGGGWQGTRLRRANSDSSGGTSAQALARGLAGQADGRLHPPLREQGRSVGPGKTHIPRNPDQSLPGTGSKGKIRASSQLAGPSPGALPVPHGPAQAGAQPGDGHAETQPVLQPQVD